MSGIFKGPTVQVICQLADSLHRVQHLQQHLGLLAPYLLAVSGSCCFCLASCAAAVVLLMLPWSGSCCLLLLLGFGATTGTGTCAPVSVGSSAVLCLPRWPLLAAWCSWPALLSLALMLPPGAAVCLVALASCGPLPFPKAMASGGGKAPSDSDDEPPPGRQPEREGDILRLFFLLPANFQCCERGCQAAYNPEVWTSRRQSLQRHLEVEHGARIWSTVSICTICDEVLGPRPITHRCLVRRTAATPPPVSAPSAPSPSLHGGD